MSIEKVVQIRIKVFAAMFVIIFMMIAVRAFELQIVDHNLWKERADKQTKNYEYLANKKNNIVDINGVYLAFDKKVYSLYATMKNITDKEKVVSFVVKQFGVNTSSILAKLDTEDDIVLLERSITEEKRGVILQQIKKVNGLVLVEDKERMYPWWPIAADIIGYEGEGRAGGRGVEKNYSDELLLEGGYRAVYRDGLGAAYMEQPYKKNDIGYSNEVKLSLDILLISNIYSYLNKSNSQSNENLSGIIYNVNSQLPIAAFNHPIVEDNANIYELKYKKFFKASNIFDTILLKYCNTNNGNNGMSSTKISSDTRKYLLENVNYKEKIDEIAECYEELISYEDIDIDENIEYAPDPKMLKDIIYSDNNVGDFIKMSPLGLLNTYSRALFGKSFANIDFVYKNKDKIFPYPKYSWGPSLSFFFEEEDDLKDKDQDKDYGHVSGIMGWFTEGDSLYMIMVLLESPEEIDHSKLPLIYENIQNIVNNYYKKPYGKTNVFGEYKNAKNHLDNIESYINKELYGRGLW